MNFAIGWLREQAGDLTAKINWGDRFKGDPPKEIVKEEESSKMSVLKWGVGRFEFAGMVAYIESANTFTYWSESDFNSIPVLHLVSA